MRTKINDELIASVEFKKMVRERNLVSAFLTTVMLLLYFGFIMLIAFRKEALSDFIFGKITWWIFTGAGMILFVWIITGVYVNWANRRYDKKKNQMKNRLIYSYDKFDQ